MLLQPDSISPILGMRQTMKQFTNAVLMFLFLPIIAFSQMPSTQLTVKQGSGFLGGIFGSGRPRIARIDLANKQRVLPLSCENVNEAEQYFFLCSPVGDWKIDADFVTENLSGIGIIQEGQTIAIESSGDIIEGTILLGFPKTIRIHEPLQFVIRDGDSLFRGEMTVPMELWPGASTYEELERQVKDAIASSNNRNAIVVCEKLLENQNYAIFPTFESMRGQRTTANIEGENRADRIRCSGNPLCAGFDSPARPSDSSIRTTRRGDFDAGDECPEPPDCRQRIASAGAG
jgi:hypothetical protein